MLNLTLTTDKLQLVTSSAANVDVHASFADLSGTTVTPGKWNTTWSAAASNDIVPGPAASTVRNVKTLHIRNRHASLSNDVTLLFNQNATLYELHKVTLLPGAQLEYVEGIGFFTLAPSTPTFGDMLMRVLSADQTGGNVSTAQNWFPTLGAVAVEGSTTYLMDGLLHTVRSAGANTHTTGLLFAGTATVTAIQWRAEVNSSDTDATSPENRTAGEVITDTTIKAASTATTEAFTLALTGIVEINAAGSFIPQFKYSAVPGGAPTIERGSFFRLVKLGSAFEQRGSWT